jgi:hypothetical protein
MVEQSTAGVKDRKARPPVGRAAWASTGMQVAKNVADQSARRSFSATYLYSAKWLIL